MKINTMSLRYLALSVSMALLLAACGSAATAGTPTLVPARAATVAAVAPAAPSTAVAQATPTKAAAPVATTAPQAAAPVATVAAQAAATATEEVLSLTSRDEGLDKLKSYRVRWNAQWTSTDAGKTDSGTWEWIEEHTTTPPAQHWTWVLTSTQSTQSGKLEFWQVDNTTYMVTTDDSGTAQCQSFSSDEQTGLTSGMFSPSALGSVSGARFVGTDTVNGVRAKHYTYSQNAIAAAGFTKASGETWVAADGGYVVKDSFSWEGTAALFGGNDSGAGKGVWTWDLMNANQPLTIRAPENCGGASADLPVMANATGKVMMGPMLNYKTVSSPADVAAFYQTEMPKKGWQADAEPSVNEGMTTLNFTKGDKTAALMITTDGGATNVIITLSE